MITLFGAFTLLNQCYSEQTSMEVSQMENAIIISLSSLGSQECEIFPSATVVTNYSYHTTTQIVINIPKIDSYLTLSGAIMKIRSYSHIFLLQIQQITLIRFKTKTIFNDFSVYYNQTTFTATTKFPTTFTSIYVTNATLCVQNYENSFLIQYSEQPIVDLDKFQLTINFNNADLSPILYITGIKQITLNCLIGQAGIVTSGQISTTILRYRNQPSPGQIEGFTGFLTAIFLKVRQSEYFTQLVNNSTTMIIYIVINQGQCQFVADLTSYSVQENIELMGYFAANMNELTFKESEVPFSDCVKITQKPGIVSVSFVFLDNAKIPITRLIFDDFAIQNSCYQNSTMVLIDKLIVIQAIGTCEIVSQSAILIVLTYESPLDYFFDNSVAVIQQNFILSRQLKVQLKYVSNKIIDSINAAYDYRILILTKNGGYFDSFEPTFNYSIELKLLVYQFSIMGGCIVLGFVISLPSIFCIRKPRIKKVGRVKIDINEM